jgi:TonB-dependent receptor
MMSRRLRGPLAAAIAIALAPSAALAGDLVGRVLDSTGRPLAGAVVVLEGTDRSAVSDSSGAFRFPEVEPGRRSVRATSIGYPDATTTVEVPATGRVQSELKFASGPGFEEIVVTGFRLAQMTSIQAKRSATAIKDVVTADDAGKLPDQNAAEALQRLPGVSISIDQGEGRYVAIRGIDPALNNVTIDGQTIGAPEDSRRVALDTIPTELLTRLEVIKAVTPDLDGNAIGGSVNLVTASAYDSKESRTLTASAETGYYDLSSDVPFGASVALTQRAGADEQFGIVLSASYSTRTYRSENLQGGSEWEEEGDFLIPDEYVLRDYELERIRKGFVANFEWRPVDGLKLHWRNLWNQFEDTEERQAAVIDYRNGDLLDQTPTSGRFTEAEAERLVKYRREKQSILNTTLGGEYAIDAWTLSADLTYGDAEQDTPFDNEWSFESSDEFEARYDTSDFFWRVDGGAPFLDAGAYEFNEVARDSQIVEEDLLTAQFDARRELEWGSAPGYVQFGAKFTGREKTSDLTSNVFDGFDGTLTLDQAAQPGRSSFLTSVRPYYTFGPRVDYGVVEGVFAGQTPDFERSDDDSFENSLADDYEVEEDVTAAYLMAGGTFGSFDVLAGARVEQTDTSFAAYDLVFEDGELVTDEVLRRGENDYTNTLPGLHVRWTANPDLYVRFAYTNTIGRPEYVDLAPRRVFEIDADGAVFEGSVEEGNPELQPLESTNLDASVEWYLQPAGLVALGLFYKDIDNPIYTRTTELEDTVFEGRPFSELTILRPENADSGRLQGIELNYKQPFAGLPAPFDGFGFTVNYTYTDGEATLFDRDEKVPFFLQPEHTGNVALFFEKYGFEARIAYTYRSEYLDEVAEDAAQDVYVDSRGQLDFKASYAFNPKWRVFLEVLNITDEPLRYLNGNVRLAENEIYSWNAVAGVQVTF